MEQTWTILAILGALLAGLISPGPSFLVVARTSLALSRQAAYAVSVGMGLASALFGIAALAGLHVILQQVTLLYLAMKLAGGAYLLYLAFRIFRGARQPLAAAEGAVLSEIPGKAGLARQFWIGFFTQISNPKTAIVFASVFATFLTREPDLRLYLILVPSIFVMETGWYLLVSAALSGQRPRAAYAGAKGWIDRIASGVLGTLGLKLMSDAA